MIFLRISLLILNSLSISYAANILAIVPTPSYSHQIAFTALWKELSLRGHNVTLITTDPINDPKLVNLTEIDVRWAYNFLKNVTQIADEFSLWMMTEGFLNMTTYISDEQLSYPPIQDLINTKRKFDVVLVEHFYPELLGFSEIFHCPKIYIASLDTFANVHQLMGNPTHPILYPEFFTPFYGGLNFRERVLSCLYNWYLSYFYTYRATPTHQKLLHKYFHTSTSIDSLTKDVDLLLLNVNPVIQGVRAVGPTTVNIGGFRPKPKVSNTLPKDLKEFLDGASDGFIYFSLGSNVKSKELGRETLDSIIAALSEVPYKVLWKYEADVLPGKPFNVKLVKWAPQQHILAHPNIKLFVTQGGLQSMEEGIYGEVPFVVIPFFADQHQNANIMRTKGIARVVERKPSINKDELKTAILEVIHNPSYKTGVQNLKRLALDTPMTGLEKAVWWTEYVIRNNGTKHLRNPAADLPTYQYYLLDVIGFLILLVVLAVWAIVVGIKLIFRLLGHCWYDKSSKLKEE